MNEKIVAVKTKYLMKKNFKLGFEGRLCYVKERLKIIYDKWELIERNEAEKNESYKQIIPYGIISVKNKIFCYKRSENSKEKRLAGKFSIGIGGHINEKDLNVIDFIRAGLCREIYEEIEINGDSKTELVGIIQDESNSVGRVHLGIVFLIKIFNENIMIKDKKIIGSEFRRFQTLYKNIDSFEAWSKICIINLSEIINIAKLGSDHEKLNSIK